MKRYAKRVRQADSDRRPFITRRRHGTHHRELVRVVSTTENGGGTHGSCDPRLTPRRRETPQRKGSGHAVIDLAIVGGVP